MIDSTNVHFLPASQQPVSQFSVPVRFACKTPANRGANRAEGIAACFRLSLK